MGTQNTSSAAHETASQLAGIETGDQSATSSSTAQSMPDSQSFFSQVAIPMSLYAASSSAMYRQRDSGSLDSDDDMDIAQRQSLGNSSVTNANS